MRIFSCVFIGILFIKLYHAKMFYGCRFFRTFYQTHSNIFKLDENQTLLTIHPLYALSNQSFSSLSIGIIYRLADTYLVPVPLLFQCSQSEQIFTPIDCEFTIVDTRSDLSIRISESTRTTTVPLYFQEYSSLKSHPIRGAYFKQSTIALRNCRLDIKKNLFISDIFHLRIEFEQKINSPCQHTCLHPQLYECSSTSNTCQCRSYENGIEKYGQICIDTELGSNCSLTPERCRRICRISDQIHCGLPVLPECNDDKSLSTCSNGYICRQKLCVKVVNESILSLPFILIALLLGAFLIIVILIIGLIKMRSIKCIKFVHPHVLSSPCSTLSSSSKSTKKICEKYTKLNLFE